MLLEFSKRIQRRISHGSNVCFVQHLCLLLCVRKSASQSISLLLTIVVTMLTAFNDIQAEHANIWRDELSFCIWEVWIPEIFYFILNINVPLCESMKFYLSDVHAANVSYSTAFYSCPGSLHTTWLERGIPHQAAK